MVWPLPMLSEKFERLIITEKTPLDEFSRLWRSPDPKVVAILKNSLDHSCLRRDYAICSRNTRWFRKTLNGLTKLISFILSSYIYFRVKIRSCRRVFGSCYSGQRTSLLPANQSAIFPNDHPFLQ